jgi:hypothetical protein
MIKISKEEYENLALIKAKLEINEQEYPVENKKQRVYYAHGMLHYDSELEQEDVKMLKTMGFEVENPNHIDNEREYIRTKDFNVFLNLVKSCNILAFRSVAGKITAGVGKEIQFAKELGMPVIELPTLLSDRFLTIEETIEYFRPKKKQL